jgi:WbqC-like protein family
MESKSCIIELQFLPPIAFFQLLVNYDVFRLEKWENYQKKSYRNKAFILSANGKETLSVPLRKGKNNQTIITDVLIADDHPWRNKMWHAIVSAYRNAPYFIHYEIAIKNQLFDAKQITLFEWNMDWIKLILKLMKAEHLHPKIVFTEDYLHNYTDESLDCRNKFKINEKKNAAEFKKYEQVFSDKFDFVPNLSILDLLFCCGPKSVEYLLKNYDPSIAN